MLKSEGECTVQFRFMVLFPLSQHNSFRCSPPFPFCGSILLPFLLFSAVTRTFLTAGKTGWARREHGQGSHQPTQGEEENVIHTIRLEDIRQKLTQATSSLYCPSIDPHPLLFLSPLHLCNPSSFMCEPLPVDFSHIPTQPPFLLQPLFLECHSDLA